MAGRGQFWPYDVSVQPSGCFCRDNPSHTLHTKNRIPVTLFTPLQLRRNSHSNLRGSNSKTSGARAYPALQHGQIDLDAYASLNLSSFSIKYLNVTMGARVSIVQCFQLERLMQVFPPPICCCPQNTDFLQYGRRCRPGRPFFPVVLLLQDPKAPQNLQVLYVQIEVSVISVKQPFRPPPAPSGTFPRP